MHKGVKVDLNGGPSADVVEIGTQDFLKLARNGSLTDLNAFLQKDGIRREDFEGALLDMHTIDGKVFALPVYPEPLALFYDTAFFEKTSSAQRPMKDWNWKQFTEVAESIKKARSAEGSSQGAALIPFDANWLESLVMSNGGSFLSPDGRRATGFMDSDATVEAIGMVAEMIRKDKVVPPYAKQWDNWSFLRGFPDEAPMIMQYFYYNNEIPVYTRLGQSYEVVQLPHFDGKEPKLAIWSYGHGIHAKSEHPDLAWQFLKELFIDSNEVSKQWIKTDLIAYKPLSAASGPYPTPTLQLFASLLPYVSKSAEYTNEDWANIRNSIVNPRLDELMRSDADVKATLTSIAQEVDQEIQKQ